jgi:alanine transaminase
VINFPSDVHDQILKMASINLCPNVSGQICCTLMMTPPAPGQPSHQLYVQVSKHTRAAPALIELN